MFDACSDRPTPYRPSSCDVVVGFEPNGAWEKRAWEEAVSGVVALVPKGQRIHVVGVSDLPTRQEILTSFTEALGPDADVQVRRYVGDLANALSDHAEATGACLILLGVESVGSGPASVSPVMMRLLETTSVPVVVLDKASRAVGDTLPIRVDSEGDPTTRRGFDWVMSLAERSGRPVEFVGAGSPDDLDDDALPPGRGLAAVSHDSAMVVIEKIYDDRAERYALDDAARYLLQHGSYPVAVLPGARLAVAGRAG